ncbi:MAG: magnesium transporter [Clostridiales bacterium]|nr:magnesium transporter [Clostridiales bacterium]
MKEILKEPTYVEELVALFQGGLSKELLLEKISGYHAHDIAEALGLLSPTERQAIYPLLGDAFISEIFSYMEEPHLYLAEINPETVAGILSHMDSDDLVDVLEKLDEEAQKKILTLLDQEAGADVKLILSYAEDEIGSKMTTNFILIKKNLTIRQAMHELVYQAGENDNISTIYVEDDNETYYGAIDLKDLIIARADTELETLISTSYPFVSDHEIICECIEKIKEYAEDSIPVLSKSGKILGVITSQDIVEVVDDELGEDYARLAGLIAEEDIRESTAASMKKRLPWLIILFFLGMAVSSVVGIFETVVAVLPIVICFQSLILDMAGNVGTQSLAVTIRVLMDENLTATQKIGLVAKEVRIGLANGLCLGLLAFAFIGMYIVLLKHNPWTFAFLISGCVGVALLIAMVISSLVGTLIPIFFHKIKIDPAIASGPLITTINDLVAVITYYGLAWLLLIQIFRLV